jgi:hypothetical protein
MLMPAKQNSFTPQRALYRYSLTAAFWPNLTTVVDGRSTGVVLRWDDLHGPVDRSQRWLKANDIFFD